MSSWKFLDEVIYKALKKRDKVSLFLCKDEEGGFGIKINGKQVFRNLPWESLEVELEGEKELALWGKYQDAQKLEKNNGSK